VRWFGPVITVNQNFGGNANDLAATLLHELGHLYNLKPEFGGARRIIGDSLTAAGVQDSASNQRLILDNCRF
jgi:hypothetical protein